MARKSYALLVPLISIVLGFALSAIIVLVTGRNLGGMFAAMLQACSGIIVKTGVFNPRYIGEFFIQVMPIVMAGLSVGFAFRTGLFNIGAEGQFMVGSLAATTVALFVQAPPVIHAILALIAAAIAGALWGAIPGWFKARFNVHEVVVTIMLNYVALYLNNWMIVGVFGSADRIKTALFPATVLLRDPALSALTNGSRFNWGFVPVLLSVLVFWFIIERTTFGYSLRAVGFNKDAARCVGMKVERNIVMSMVIAGAFAAIGGAIMTIGTFNYGRVLSAMEGYGFDGIAVALVGGNAALGILFAGMLFGMLKAAQPLMQSQGIPKDIASIIQASIVLFVAMKYGVTFILDRVLARKKAEVGRVESGS